MPGRPRQRRVTHPGPWATFGEGLAVRRRLLGLTQQDLADLADVAVSTVQGLEAGRASTRLGSLVAVLEALGLVLAAVPTAQARTLVVAARLEPSTGQEPSAAASAS